MILDFGRNDRRGPAPAGTARSIQESKLVQATRHVAEGQRIVARQRRLVARQKAHGHDTETAELLLNQFEKTLAIFEADLEAIQSEKNSN